MPLQLAISQPNGSVAEHLLYEGREYRIGRDEQSDVVIVHPQVSRQHANISATDEQWQFEDLSSSGCYQNGRKIERIEIAKEQSLHIGPVPCNLRPIDFADVIRLDSQRVWRERQLLRYQSQINRCESTTALVHLSRECLTQSLGCERAALILFEDAKEFQVNIGYEPWMQAENFTGSRTIIQHVLKEKTTKAIGNIVTEQQFAHQNSVIRHGIQAAICVPVCVGEKATGVLYADSIEGRRYFTQTDIAFAKSLAHQLSLRLLYHRIEQKLRFVS